MAVAWLLGHQKKEKTISLAAVWTFASFVFADLIVVETAVVLYGTSQ